MKKISRRSFMTLVGAGSASALFAACSTDTSTSSADSSQSDSQASSADTATGEEATVVVWTEDRHDAEYMQEVVAQFNAENAGRVQIDYVISTDNYLNTISMAVSSNQAPDLFVIGSGSGGWDLNTYVTAGIVQPIGEYVTDEYKEIYNLEKLTIQNVTAKGDDIYFIPTLSNSGSRLVYNKEYFEKAGIEKLPTTLDEFVSVAAALTAVGDGVQFGTAMPGQSAPFVRIINPVAYASGIQPYDYVNGRYDFTKYAPIIEATRKLFDDGSMIPGATTLKIDPLRVQFAEGNIGMYGASSVEVGVLTTQFPAQIEWGVMPHVTIDGEVKGKMGTNYNKGYAMTSTCEQQVLSWEVAEYLSGAQAMKGYVENGLGFSLSDQITEMVDTEKLGQLELFMPITDDAVYPQFPVVTPKGQNYQDAIWNASQPGTGDITEILAEITADYNEALDESVAMGKVQRLVIADFDAMNPSAGTQEFLSE